MALTKEDKSEIRRQVYRLKNVGYSKQQAIELLHVKYLWKKNTIAKYWKAINEKKAGKK